MNAGTTPQPYHPRDLQAASYEKLEIRDGTVYRNVSFFFLKKKSEEIYTCQNVI